MIYDCAVSSVFWLSLSWRHLFRLCLTNVIQSLYLPDSIWVGFRKLFPKMVWWHSHYRQLLPALGMVLNKFKVNLKHLTFITSASSQWAILFQQLNIEWLPITCDAIRIKFSMLIHLFLSAYFGCTEAFQYYLILFIINTGYCNTCQRDLYIHPPPKLTDFAA